MDKLFGERYLSLQANFRLQKHAVSGYKQFLKHLKKKKLHRVLRAHTTEPIKRLSETEFRNNFDFLLDYYSIMVSGILIGYLPFEVIQKSKDEAKQLLENHDVVKYYSKYYPLTLLKIANLMLYKDIEFDNSLIFDHPSAKKVNDYEDFLQLYRARSEDEYIDHFLSLLDDYVYYNSGDKEWYSIDDLWKLLGSIKKIKEFNTNKSRNIILEDGISGLVKFMEYLYELAFILEKNSNDRMFQSVLWSLDEYWFKKLAKHSGGEIKKALDNIGRIIQSGYFVNHGQDLDKDLEFFVKKEWIDTSAIEVEKAKSVLDYVLNKKLRKPVRKFYKNLIK